MSWILMFFPLTFATATEGDVEVEQPTKEIWAGLQVSEAVRNAPLIGEIRSRTVTRSLAQVERNGDEIVIREVPCFVDLDNDGPIDLSMDDAAIQRSPPTLERYVRNGDTWHALPWKGAWGDKDLDLNGTPGMRIGIKASVCTGWIEVDSTTTSEGTATALPDGGLAGNLSTSIDRNIVDASNWCLKLIKKHSEEQVTGDFTWVPVESNSTCESLPRAQWPIPYEAPSKKKK